MKITTYLHDNDGNKIGWIGYGSTECPECGFLCDIGTGEHSLPNDVTFCSNCNKEFSYTYED